MWPFSSVVEKRFCRNQKSLGGAAPLRTICGDISGCVTYPCENCSNHRQRTLEANCEGCGQKFSYYRSWDPDNCENFEPYMAKWCKKCERVVAE